MVQKKVIARASAKNKAEVPFEEVVRAHFSFAAPKSREETAFLQYNLLLKKEVLQLHLDFESKKGSIVCLPTVDLAVLLAEHRLSPKFRSIEWIPYEKYLAMNSICSL